uniref:Uncharacterized protein n=1 Tax=Anopheles albimanus TaxID=7167 RepID=A0A182F1I3_ANOAL
MATRRRSVRAVLVDRSTGFCPAIPRQASRVSAGRVSCRVPAAGTAVRFAFDRDDIRSLRVTVQNRETPVTVIRFVLANRSRANTRPHPEDRLRDLPEKGIDSPDAVPTAHVNNVKMMRKNSSKAMLNKLLMRPEKLRPKKKKNPSPAEEDFKLCE